MLITGTQADDAAICNKFYPLRDRLTTLFKAQDGQCTALARAAIRLAFHDAGAFTLSSYIGGNNIPRGGADGSLLIDPEEIKRGENNGLQTIVQTLQPMAAQYGISSADLVQYAGIHATISCPGGPIIKFLVGRQDAVMPQDRAPDGFLPPADGSADFLIALFRDKGMDPLTLAALMGAHSTSTQKFVDPSRAGSPQDSTPGTWDVAYYGETLQGTNPKIFTFQSDRNMARDPRMRDEWLSFVNGQGRWSGKYADAHFQMSLWGVANQSLLVDCTATLPAKADIGVLGTNANKASAVGIQ